MAETRVEAAPQELTTRTKRFVLDNEADLIGVCRLDPHCLFEDYKPPDLPWVVVIAGKMDYKPIIEAMPTMAAD